MKKILFTAIMAAAVTLSSFAADVTKVNRIILNKFATEYAGAENVSWKVTNEFTKVSFVFEGEALEVFYNADGEQIATSKKVDFKSIPFSAQKTIRNKYASYAVLETVLLEKAGIGTHFYVSVENNGKKKVLEVSLLGDVSVYNK